MPVEPVIPREVPLSAPQISRNGNIASAPLQGTQSSAGAIARLNYSHDAMCDVIIANPAISRTALAAMFGYTPAWVSRVLNSDAFQMRLAVRKADIIDPSLVLSIEEKLKTLVSESLDVLIDKLAATKSTEIATKGLEIGVKALGYGARQQNVTVQQSFVVAMPTPIQDQAAWAQKHGSGEGAIDVSSRTLDERLAEAEAKERNAQ
jgi:hypothetical protein